jgi:Zn-dependent metalloprotease
MRTIYTIVLQIALLAGVFAQTPMKQIDNKPFVAALPLQVAHSPTTVTGSNRLGNAWRPATINSIYTHPELIASSTVSTSGSFWIDLKPNNLWASRTTLKALLENILPVENKNEPWVVDWMIVSENGDQQGITHVRVQQTLAGKLIHGQDMILHIDHGSVRDINGFAWTGRMPSGLSSPASSAEAIQAVKDYLIGQNVRFQDKYNFPGLDEPDDEANLVWFPKNGKLVLAYEINIHPNMMDHWTVFAEATTFEILKSYSQLCAFAPLHLYDLSCAEENANTAQITNELQTLIPPVLMDGPTTISDQDLNGSNRTVNGYQVGSSFFMIDASRPGMFQGNQSVMPNEPVGTIWTVDAQNTSPQQASFEVVHVTNTNNNWKNLEVSAHFNGGQAYEYFRSTFNRNSINGTGGNIISIINVTDENNNNMDNAFWGGAAMFYGNGDVSFQPLAKGLDVAGHEMSHGVIQNTANLEYIGQSGALNESYADVFGSMIDRDDWLLGEDVVKPSAFPSGALRDLSNPNNGGNNLGDPGWQPKHMNEYQDLPNTPQGDNGGVHVNSGIPNKAFFNLATAIGKEKAEQIYYKALTDYLVKSSQFVDMRNAIEKAATDLHGANSPEVIAVRNAFADVGIGEGDGEDYEEDIEVNSGDDFIICTDELESDLYWVPPGNPSQFVKMNVPSPISRPSFTDDGSACVYVDEDNNMIVVNFDWSQGLDFEWGHLESNPQGIWRNVVTSKDGTRIAFTTSNLRNEINVFNFNTGANDVFELYNPTTAEGGVNTGDVLYPDILEWDYSGEYLMYDALNRIESAFGDGIEYWNISFLNAWDNAINNLGSGQVGNLFSGLPENVSVGNPSFAKNSPYIITFDYLESFLDNFGQVQTDYRIKAANIETGEVNDIFQNTTVGYPNYSRLDNKILFTYDDNGTLNLATIDVQNENKTLPVVGTAVGLFGQAQKGVWFTTGDRIFTSTENAAIDENQIRLTPQPVHDVINVSGEHLPDNADFIVFDLTGRTIRKGALDADNAIQIGALSAGTYMLQLIHNKVVIMNARFIKQ